MPHPSVDQGGSSNLITEKKIPSKAIILMKFQMIL